MWTTPEDVQILVDVFLVGQDASVTKVVWLKANLLIPSSNPLYLKIALVLIFNFHLEWNVSLLPSPKIPPFLLPFLTAVGILKVTRSSDLSDIITISNTPCENTTSPEDCIWDGKCGCISRICTSMRSRELTRNSSEKFGSCVCISFPYTQSKFDPVPQLLSEFLMIDTMPNPLKYRGSVLYWWHYQTFLNLPCNKTKVQHFLSVVYDMLFNQMCTLYSSSGWKNKTEYSA